MTTINEELVLEVNRALDAVKRSSPDLDPATTCSELRTVTTPAGMYFEAVIAPFPVDSDLRRTIREALAERSLNVSIATRW